MIIFNIFIALLSIYAVGAIPAWTNIFKWPARSKSSVEMPLSDDDLNRPFLYAPGERDLLGFQIEHVWPLDDFWNVKYVNSLCTYAVVKQDIRALKWYIQKGIDIKHPWKSYHGKLLAVNDGLFAIFDAILRQKNRRVIMEVFPMAKQLTQEYFHFDYAASIISQISDERIVSAYKVLFDYGSLQVDFPDILTRKTASNIEADNAVLYIQTFKTMGFHSQLRVIEVAREKIGIVKLSRNEDAFSKVRTLLAELGEVNIRIELVCHLLKNTAEKLQFLDSELIRRFGSINEGNSNMKVEKFLECFPSVDDPEFGKYARKVIEKLPTQESHWKSYSVPIMLNLGILNSFMRKAVRFELLKSGLSGPVWSRLEHYFAVADLAEPYYPRIRECLPKSIETDEKTFKKIALSVSGMALITLIDLIETPHYVEKSLHGKALNCISFATDKQKSQFSRYLFYHSEHARIVYDRLLRLHDMALRAGGHAKVTYDEFSRNVLAAGASVAFESLTPAISDVPRLFERDKMDFTSADVEFIHGRTAYLKDRPRAVKFKKDGPGDDDLDREFRMDIILNQMAPELELTSELPKNPILLDNACISQELKDRLMPDTAEYKLKLMKLNGKCKIYHGLAFDPPPGYEIPIHDAPSLESLMEASKKALGDTAILARTLGLVSEAPADLYHNHETDRPYKWNVDIEHHDMIGRGRLGAGRLDKWRNSIRHVNMGMNGIRDLKHYKFIDDIREKTLGSRMGTLFTHVGNFLFSWMLAVGEWFVKNIPFDLQSLQMVLRQGLSIFMHKYTRTLKLSCLAFVDGALQLDRLARQMRYFMGKEYVRDLNAKRQVPTGIYQVIGTHSTNQDLTEYWNDEKGWTRNAGQEDLGPYNGPFPITEMIRTIHIVMTTVLNMAAT